jgi:hypothetical protein
LAALARAIILREATMTAEKNIALADDLLERVREQARVEGISEDELMNEAALTLLDSRQRVSNLRSFVARNSARAQALGLAESDVLRLIAETRAERVR